jgi:predicted RNA-binding protein (virulence factor B family)
MKKYAKWLGIVIVLLSLLMLLPSNALATSNHTSPWPWPTPINFAFEITTFSGEVESLPDGLVPGEWVIAGKTLYVGFGTRFNVSPATIQVGDTVQVKAFKKQDGTLIALQILKINPNEVKFVGVIEEINDSFWVVDGRTVIITDETVFHGDSPDVGDYAGVLAEETEEGLVAEHIMVVDAVRAVIHFPGVIRSMDESSWVVATPAGDKTITITEDTVMQGDEPDVGDRVKVWASVTLEEELIATRIVVTDTPSEVHFKGRIQEIATDYWIVARQMVLITEETTIEGDEPSVGDVAEVWATPTEDGLVGTRILVTSLQQFSVIQGVIESQEDDVWVIAGSSVVITIDTKIIGNPQVGDTVVAVVHTDADGIMVARNITKIPGGNSDAAPNPPAGRPRPGSGKR